MPSSEDKSIFPTTNETDRLERIERYSKIESTTIKRQYQRDFIIDCATSGYFREPILDVGCGYRSNEPEICCHQKLKTFTLDKSFANNTRGEIPDYICDAEDMYMITDNAFGSVACTEVLEHTRNPAKLTSEIYRVLKPEGFLICTVPFWIEIHEKRELRDYWRFTPRGLQLVLKFFNIISITSVPTQAPARRIGIHAIVQKPSHD